MRVKVHADLLKGGGVVDLQLKCTGDIASGVSLNIDAEISNLLKEGHGNARRRGTRTTRGHETRSWRGARLGVAEGAGIGAGSGRLVGRFVGRLVGRRARGPLVGVAVEPHPVFLPSLWALPRALTCLQLLRIVPAAAVVVVDVVLYCGLGPARLLRRWSTPRGAGTAAAVGHRRPRRRRWRSATEHRFMGTDRKERWDGC